MPQAVMYGRVSTGRQGRSGLGLEAQKAAVELFAVQHGFELEGESSKSRLARVTMPLLAGQSLQRLWPMPRN
jgi:DNA invertase Pin-like site-specific DNA recombinase